MKKARRKLKNLNVEFVSFVDRGANLRTFYLTKEFEENKKEPEFQMSVKLICSDNEEERKVYGLVYAPDTVDAHGDYTDAETLEKAAHNFMLNYQKMDVQHNMEDGAGKVVESFIAPETFMINGEEIIKGSWVLVSLANEKVWESIKKGEITGYSLYGTAEVEYEKVNILDLIGSIFRKEKIQINQNMEVIMDDELKKALENIELITKKMEEYESTMKSIGETVTEVVSSVKGLNESMEAVKKFIDEVKVDDIKKSFEEMQNKVNDVIEAVSKSIVPKNVDNDIDEDENSRQRMI
jgi:hypothetical protein